MSGTLTSLCVFLLLLYPVKPQDDAMPLLDEFGGGFSAAGNSMSLDAVAGVDNNGATGTKKNRGGLIVGVSISMAVILLTALLFYIVRRKKMPDVVEDRDHDIGPHKATEGFKEKERIGSGGFCRVYKVIRQNPDTQVAVNRVSQHSRQDTQVAVNRVSQHSRQGLRAFIPAVPTIGGNVTGGNVKGGDVTGGNINVGDVTGSHVTGAALPGATSPGVTSPTVVSAGATSMEAASQVATSQAAKSLAATSSAVILPPAMSKGATSKGATSPAATSKGATPLPFFISLSPESPVSLLSLFVKYVFVLSLSFFFFL